MIAFVSVIGAIAAVITAVATGYGSYKTFKDMRARIPLRGVIAARGEHGMLLCIEVFPAKPMFLKSLRIPGFRLAFGENRPCHESLPVNLRVSSRGAIEFYVFPCPSGNAELDLRIRTAGSVFDAKCPLFPSDFRDRKAALSESFLWEDVPPVHPTATAEAHQSSSSACQETRR